MGYGDEYQVGGAMTPVVKNLLMLNIGVFLLQLAFPRVLENMGALFPVRWSLLQPWRFVSYMFLHAGFFHILMNMYGLFLFGPMLEQTLGKKRFLTLYFVSGILGGIGWAVLAPARLVPCVGASGAIFGLLMSFAALYPSMQIILLFPPIPLKMWQFALGYGVIELIHVLGQHGGRVANSAHLAGGLAGLAYTLYLIRKVEPWRFKRLFSGLDRWQEKMDERKENRSNASREEINRILDKVSRHGIGSLTPREREILRKASRG